MTNFKTISLYICFNILKYDIGSWLRQDIETFHNSLNLKCKFSDIISYLAFPRITQKVV